MLGGWAYLPNLSAMMPEAMRPTNDPAFKKAKRLFDMKESIPYARP